METIINAEQAEFNDNLMVVTQLPVIEQQLTTIKEKFETEVAAALAMPCTEETLSAVKTKRAELTKIYNALEAKRKEIKKSILTPYDAFEQVYKECVTNVYSPCDEELKAKVATVENGLKSDKRDKVKDYFDEYCASLQIDFVAFERIGLNITLTVSHKKLREQVKSFLDKVNDELQLIATQEHGEEILVEYKNSLNVAQAITTVVNRHKAIEEEKLRKEALKAASIEKAKAVEKVEEAVEALAPPVAAPMPQAEQISEKNKEQRYETTFTVCGTLAQLKALKNFLEEGEYQYAQQ